MFAVLVFGLCGTAAAQNPAPEKTASPAWTLQVDPLTTALGFVHIQAEYALSSQWSVYLGPSLKLFAGPQEDPATDDYVGYGAEFGVRWFFLGGAPQGWWAQVRGVLGYVTGASPTQSALGGYASVLCGYTWIFDGWFVLSAGLGAQYLHYKVADQGLEGFLPAAHTTVGVAF